MPDTLTPRRALVRLVPAILAAGLLALLAGPAEAASGGNTPSGRPLPSSHRFHGSHHRRRFRHQRNHASNPASRR